MERVDREVALALDAAVRLARDGLVVEALAACAQVLRNAPTHRAAWRTRAHLLAREEAWDEAIGSLSCIMVDEAPIATDLLSRGRWCLEAGDTVGAMRDLSALLALGFEETARPWRPLALLLRSVAGCQLGFHAKVLRDSAGLPPCASVLIAGRRWYVREMQHHAAAALRDLPRFPFSR